jgi:hypothetical protein
VVVENNFGGKLILKADIKEMGWESVDWINLAQYEDSGGQLSQLYTVAVSCHNCTEWRSVVTTVQSGGQL